MPSARYSPQFDDWDPASFRLSEPQIADAIALVPEQAIRDTDYCQANVRKFAQAQLATLLPLEVEIRPGVILGHRHIPVNSVGSYIPGGRYPMFGSAQMSIIPARVAGVKRIVACTPPVKGQGYYPATINAIHKAGADRDLRSWRRACSGLDGFRSGWMTSRWMCFVGQGIVLLQKRRDNCSVVAGLICLPGPPRFS